VFLTLIGEIAAASTERNTSITQINDAIMKMDNVTQQNTALVEKAATAESMMDQTEQLMSAVSVFSIKDDNTQYQPRMLL
jgi:methyl-accepting chemotaxis protein